MATSPVTFIGEVREELKKVVWPSGNEVLRLTVLVIIISIIVGLYIGAIDFVFTKITEALIK